MFALKKMTLHFVTDNYVVAKNFSDYNEENDSPLAPLSSRDSLSNYQYSFRPVAVLPPRVFHVSEMIQFSI